MGKPDFQSELSTIQLKRFCGRIILPALHVLVSKLKHEEAEIQVVHI